MYVWGRIYCVKYYFFAGRKQDMVELRKHLRTVCSLLATHAQGIEVTEVCVGQWCVWRDGG